MLSILESGVRRVCASTSSSDWENYKRKHLPFTDKIIFSCAGTISSIQANKRQSFFPDNFSKVSDLTFIIDFSACMLKGN